MTRNWIAPSCDYRFDGNTVIAVNPATEKITGTQIGAILGCSPYGSPFTASAKLLGLWGEDISDKPAVRTGVALEGRIIDHIRDTHPSWSVMSSSDVFAPRTGNHRDWKSDWEDDVFGGHLDGVITIDGEDYVLEVKTARDLTGWVDHPPAHYLWQVYLYNHFMTKQDKAFIALGVVDQSTYSDPNSWVPSSSNTMLFEVPIDQQAVQRTIEQLRGWYWESVGKGVTVPYDPDNLLDSELWQYLNDVKSDVPELVALVNEYRECDNVVKEAMDSVKDAQTRQDELKERLKTVMRINGITQVDTAKLTVQNRVSYDTARARQDGINLEPYKTTKEIYTLRM